MGYDVQKALEALQAQMKELRQEAESEKLNRQELEAKLAQVHNALPDLASTLDEIARRNQLAESKPWKAPVLKETNGYKEGSIRKENPETLPFTGKKDCCPYCTEHGRASLLDITKSGRWACRTCGKHWYGEALGEKYSKELERYIREEGTEDPVKAFRKEKEAEDNAEEVADLKKQVAELTQLILKSSLVTNGKKDA